MDGEEFFDWDGSDDRWGREPFESRVRRARVSFTRGQWTTARGEVIAFRDMSDRHLLNTIAYVERDYRGLQDTFCDEALDINLLWPQHAGLVAEARRRRLIPRGKKGEMVTA